MSAAFRGRWKVTRTIVDVATPLGLDKAPAAELRIAERQQRAAAPVTFDARFVATSDTASYGERVIPDRAFNAEQREAALTGEPIDDFDARWSASNPNVVTMRRRSTGEVTETKVTKRSTEAPAPNAFGTSEYARVADAGSSGVLGGVPRTSPAGARPVPGASRTAACWSRAATAIETLAVNVFDRPQTASPTSGACPS